MNKKIMLTSRGLNCSLGRKVIDSGLTECISTDYHNKLSDKTIMLCTINEYKIDTILTNAAVSLGFSPKNITIWDDTFCAKRNTDNDVFDYIYVTEGNTFQIMQMLRLTAGDKIIKKSMLNGGFYIGASAGAIIACTSIELASDFDSNFVRITNYEGLNILPDSLGNTALMPHFTEELFEEWKNSIPSYISDKYDYIDYIPDDGFKIF